MSKGQAVVNDSPDDITSCRAQSAGFSDLVTCMTDKFACPYLVYFGKERYCSHPENELIAINTQSD